MRVLISFLVVGLVMSGCDLVGTADTAGEGPGPGTVLTDVGGFSVLTWTEAGDELLLRRPRGGDTRLVAVDPASGSSRIVSRALTYEGQRLGLFKVVAAGGVLFLHTGQGLGENYRYSIDRLVQGAGEVERLLDLGDDYPLNLAAPSDGTSVLYASQQREVNLRRLDVATGTDTGLATIEASELGRPFFSPTADRLVYATGEDRVDETGQGQAHLLDVESGAEQTAPFDGRLLDVLWPAQEAPQLVYVHRSDDTAGFLDLTLHVRPIGASTPTGQVVLPDSDDRYGRLSRPTDTAFTMAIDPTRRYLLYARSTHERLTILAHEFSSGDDHVLATHTYGANSFGGEVYHMSFGADPSRVVYRIADRLYTLTLNL